MIPAHSNKLQRFCPQTWDAPARVVKPGQRFFWSLMLLELSLLLGLFAWALGALTPSAPVALADSAARREVVDAVYARVAAGAPDRMISVEPGVLARESNVRGFTVDGRVYYYQLLGQPSFDPLSRGQLQPAQVEVIYQSNAPAMRLSIYTVNQ